MVYKLSPFFRRYTPQLLILIPRQHAHFVFRTPCFVAVLQRNVHNILFIYLSNLWSAAFFVTIFEGCLLDVNSSRLIRNLLYIYIFVCFWICRCQNLTIQLCQHHFNTCKKPVIYPLMFVWRLMNLSCLIQNTPNARPHLNKYLDSNWFVTLLAEILITPKNGWLIFHGTLLC